MKYVVTIARTYGSGGKEIGKLLAKELGIKYYGREIFEMSQGVESDLDSGDDESIHNASLEEADELFKQQSKTIRDMDNVVKIYLYAPIRDCMRRVIRLYELNPEDAKSLIHSMNKTRGDYYQHNTGLNWSEAVHYDICLNTAGLKKEKIIDIIKNYIKTKID